MKKYNTFLVKYFVVNVVLLCASVLIYHYYAESIIPTPSLYPYYDYIIVGGGTAGCVVGALLSEASNVNVLLIEAGDEFNILSKIPLTPTLIQRGSNDWSFTSTPQKFSSFGLKNKRQFIPRGKGLGGSGQLNYLLHDVGIPSDYDNWIKLGARGWYYSDLKPYFEKIFMLEKHSSDVGTKVIKKNARVHFKNKKAQAIEIVLSDNATHRIITRNEIIISCGSIKTPQLLMLSGIGPEHHLKEHNIEVVVNSESVGRNLHDHLNFPLYVSIDKPLSVTLSKMLAIKTLTDYLWSGKGYISSSAIAAIGRGPNSTSLTLFALGSADETILREIANTDSETFRAFFPLHHNSSQEGFVFLANCLQPESRGSITLLNADPHSSPIIDPNYLSINTDIECTIRAIRLAIEVISTKAFKDIGAVIQWPKLKTCQHLWTDDVPDVYLECIVRVGALTGHHSAGTCSMAGDTPVVDQYLQLVYL
ncbi:neither inactivation nor afterpotential protein G [Arctopsyche grandis]|uniref:neither inactivation nor afterpotential protein G n=1 Tax=Arctopsyche grandis TaxID=121162 RepID=UPI00406D968E